MTDNEIIKALECCIKDDYDYCNDCPYKCDKHFNSETLRFETMPNGMTYNELACDEWLKTNALNLINRQKAKNTELIVNNNALKRTIQILKEENNSLKAHNDSLMARCADINSAVRAFAEILKTKALQKFDWNEYVEVEDIDKLVKELTERKDKENDN